MARYSSPPQKLIPQFKFGDTVTIETPFYGSLAATVDSVVEVQTGYWFWTKYRLMYQLSVHSEGMTVYAEEDILKLVPPKLRPVR